MALPPLVWPSLPVGWSWRSWQSEAMPRVGAWWAQVCTARAGWRGPVLPLADGVYETPEGLRAVVAAVTGSGKSLLQAALCRAVADQVRGVGGGAGRTPPVVVLATLSLLLVRQYADADLPRFFRRGEISEFHGGRKSISGRVIVTTYDSLPKLLALLAAAGREVALIQCDEVHGTEPEARRAAIAGCGAWGRLGCSATPFRAAKEERLQLWDDLLYDYTDQHRAVADGAIVRHHVYPWHGAMVPTEEEQDAATLEMIRVHRLVDRGPFLVTASDAADAAAFAEVLVKEGIAARAVSCYDGKGAAKALFAAMRKGEVICAVAVRLLSTGVDFPPFRAVVLRVPLGSRTLLAQTIGRGVRAEDPRQYPEMVERYGRKAACLVLDPLGAVPEVGLDHEAALGVAEEEPEEEAPARERMTYADELRQHSGRWTRAGTVVEAWAGSLLQGLGTLGLPLCAVPVPPPRMTDRDVVAVFSRLAAEVKGRPVLGWWRDALGPEHAALLRWALVEMRRQMPATLGPCIVGEGAMTWTAAAALVRCCEEVRLMARGGRPARVALPDEVWVPGCVAELMDAYEAERAREAAK